MKPEISWLNQRFRRNSCWISKNRFEPWNSHHLNALRVYFRRGENVRVMSLGLTETRKAIDASRAAMTTGHSPAQPPPRIRQNKDVHSQTGSANSGDDANIVSGAKRRIPWQRKPSHFFCPTKTFTGFQIDNLRKGCVSADVDQSYPPFLLPWISATAEFLCSWVQVVNAASKSTGNSFLEEHVFETSKISFETIECMACQVLVLF